VDLFCRRWFRRDFSYLGDAKYKYTDVSKLSVEYAFRNCLDTVSKIMKMSAGCNFVNNVIGEQ